MNKSRMRQPVVVLDLVPPDLPITIDWSLAPRSQWHAISGFGYWHPVPHSLQEEFEEILAQESEPSSASWRSRVTSILDRLAPRGEYRVWFPADAGIAGVRRLLARHGEAALLPVVEYLSDYDRLKVFVKDAFDVIGSIASPRLALYMAEVSQRRQSEQAGTRARIWLARYSGVAIQGLIPFAVGRRGKSRRIAENALRSFDAEGYSVMIFDAAAKYGNPALSAVGEMLSFGSRQNFPLRPITVPKDVAEVIALQRIIYQRRVSRSGQQGAATQLELIAASCGLTFDELDRSVPDLGIDNAGSVRLDYGPRVFTAKLTEKMAIELIDDVGKQMKTLPKPRLSDDATLANEARLRLGELRKNLRSLISLQKTRLELAMCQETRWIGSDFIEHVLGHPILSQVARKLVWALFGDDDVLTAAFRISETGVPIGLHDGPMDIAADANVGVAHPLHLDPHRQEWSDLLAAHRIEQPFRQLLRTTYRAEDDKVGSHFGLHGATVTTKGLLWLDREDWSLSFEDTSKWYLAITRGYGTGYIKLEIDPPIYVVTSDTAGHDYQNPKGKKHGQHTITVAELPELPPIAYSEAIRQLLMIRVD